MKILRTVVLALSVLFSLLLGARECAAEDGTPYASYGEFLGLVESNAIASVHYSPANHTVIARKIVDQTTNNVACMVPWFGGTLDPLLERLLVNHHVAIAVEEPQDDRWQVLATSSGVLLVPILMFILLIVIFVRQTKIMKKLDIS